MSIGSNAPMVDKLIKKTTAPTSQDTGMQSAAETVQQQAPVKKQFNPRAQLGKENATTNTVKMTFYIKQDLLEQLYNYAYWDRMTVTEAFNTALVDGMKNKNTKPIKK